MTGKTHFCQSSLDFSSVFNFLGLDKDALREARELRGFFLGACEGNCFESVVEDEEDETDCFESVLVTLDDVSSLDDVNEEDDCGSSLEDNVEVSLMELVEVF